jgi:hypothetical protein
MKTLSGIVVALTFVLSGTAAWADEDSSQNLWDYTFQLRAGAFFPDLDSSIRLDSSLGRIGDGLNFERDLGMDDAKNTFYAGASWQFARKHTLEWEFFDLGRDGTVIIDSAREIGDSTILADGQISSTFNIRINRLTYRYRFYEDARKSAVFLAGIHGVRARARLSLSGQLLVDGEPVLVAPEDPITELEKINVPLPHFGIGMNYVFSPDIIGIAMLKGFAIEIGDTAGSLVEANLGFQYQVSKNFGIGGGLKWFFLDIVEDETDLADVKMEFDFFGPSLYLSYLF